MLCRSVGRGDRCGGLEPLEYEYFIWSPSGRVYVEKPSRALHTQAERPATATRRKARREQRHQIGLFRVSVPARTEDREAYGIGDATLLRHVRHPADLVENT